MSAPPVPRKNLAAFVKKDFELWDKLIRQQGIKLD